VVELAGVEINASDAWSSGQQNLEQEEKRLLSVMNRDQERTMTSDEDMQAFVPKKFWEYVEVSIKSTFDSLPPHTEYDHAIHLNTSFIPQRGKIYLLSPHEQKALDKFLEENLKIGRINPSKSPQAAPFFFRPKGKEVNTPGGDPGLELIQDYQYLNVYTVRD
jgi:hypothetical protein